MKRLVLLMTTALLIVIAVSAWAQQPPRAHRTAALLRRQPPRHADQPGAGRHVQPDVVEREGLRRDLLGRELLVRPGARRHRRAEPRRRRRTCRPTTPGSRSSTTTARSTPRAGSASRIPATSAANMTPPLVLNEPLGSDIANGVLYLADRDGGTSPTDPAVSVDSQVQHADRRAGRRDHASTSRPASTTSRSPTTARSTRRRPAPAGRIPDATTWQVWKITPGGTASIFVQGAPLRQPNGIAFDSRATSSSSTSAPTRC